MLDPKAIELACAAHAPQWGGMDSEIKRYAREQMEAAITSYLSSVQAEPVVYVSERDLEFLRGGAYREANLFNYDDEHRVPLTAALTEREPVAATECPTCHGTGEDVAGVYDQCQNCDGKGIRSALVATPPAERVVKRITDGVICEQIGDEIVLVLTADGEGLSAILDEQYAKELRDKLNAILTAERVVEARPHPLEAYADSYAQMARMGDGTVDCRSVEVDIRQNMIPVTTALAAKPAVKDDERVSDAQISVDLEDAILACEKGDTVYDVLANYRSVRRTIQLSRAVLATQEQGRS